MRQLVYTVLISNNRVSFDLWGKENLVKLQKVSKYYENDCSLQFNLAPLNMKPGADSMTVEGRKRLETMHVSGHIWSTNHNT